MKEDIECFIAIAIIVAAGMASLVATGFFLGVGWNLAEALL